MRIWQINPEPRAKISTLRHDRPYFWEVLTAGKASSRYEKGNVMDIVYHCGETKHFPERSSDNLFVYDITSPSDIPLIFVTVKFGAFSENHCVNTIR